MYPIEIPDFASKTTREAAEAHNSNVGTLEASKAKVEREAAELAKADFLTADVDRLDSQARKLRQQRWANTKTEISLNQARLPLISSLRADRKAAQDQAAQTLESARAEVVNGLRALGFAALLATTDTIVKMQVAQLLDCAAGPSAALARLQEVRDWALNLTQAEAEAKGQIIKLSNTLKADVSQAVRV
jgi:hypothetical protein